MSPSPTPPLQICHGTPVLREEDSIYWPIRQSIHMRADLSVFFTEPVWQNFSSMYREARTARSAATGMEASHHITATLYFGISALEAFLNQQMRSHLSGTPEKEIFDVLRKETIATKIKKWPVQILGAGVDLRPSTLERLFFYIGVRGDLTHPKYADHRDYEKLSELDPMEVVDSIAEFMAQFLLVAGQPFHYWLWGWNYLNPSRQGVNISLLPDSQIYWSMRSLGYSEGKSFHLDYDGWRNAHMRGYAAYARIASFLEGLDHCEPKHREFPYQPKLCRRWWDPEHHATCGNVTAEAIRFAVNFNPYDEARTEAAVARFQKLTPWQRLFEQMRFLIVGK